MTINIATWTLTVTAILSLAGPVIAEETPEATKPTVVPLMTRDLPEYPG
jgi:hypothetical protein